MFHAIVKQKSCNHQILKSCKQNLIKEHEPKDVSISLCALLFLRKLCSCLEWINKSASNTWHRMNCFDLCALFFLILKANQWKWLHGFCDFDCMLLFDWRSPGFHGLACCFLNYFACLPQIIGLHDCFAWFSCIALVFLNDDSNLIGRSLTLNVYACFLLITYKIIFLCLLMLIYYILLNKYILFPTHLLSTMLARCPQSFQDALGLWFAATSFESAAPSIASDLPTPKLTIKTKTCNDHWKMC